MAKNPLRIVIDLQAIIYNYNIIKERNSNSKIIAVIKGNAYGHGLKQVALQLSNIVDVLAVSCCDEGLKLRKAGIKIPILILQGLFHIGELQIVKKYNLWLVIHTIEQIKYLEKYNIASTNSKIFIKINTGMNRLGISVEQVPETILKIKQLGIKSIVLMTHLISSDITHSDIVKKQLASFYNCVNKFNLPLSISNSGAILSKIVMCDNWLRVGIMLYGVIPGKLNDFNKIKMQKILKPVMSFESEIIAIKEIEAFEYVGYDATWQSDKKTKIAIVAVGYKDGYPIQTKKGVPVAVCGIKTTIVGRVSMNMITVDITNIKQAKIGSKVELWGRKISILDVASFSNSTPHSLMANLSESIRRVYINC